jgi:hypothetical protein
MLQLLFTRSFESESDDSMTLTMTLWTRCSRLVSRQLHIINL